MNNEITQKHQELFLEMAKDDGFDDLDKWDISCNIKSLLKKLAMMNEQGDIDFSNNIKQLPEQEQNENNHTFEFRKFSDLIADKYHIPRETAYFIGLSIISSVFMKKIRVLDNENNKQLPIGLNVVAEQSKYINKSNLFDAFKYPIIHEKENKNHSFFNGYSALKIDDYLIENDGYVCFCTDELNLANEIFNKKSVSNLVSRAFSGNSYGGTGKKSYSGNVVGSISCFVKKGTLNNIFSGDSELLSKCIFLNEDDQLGKRVHSYNEHDVLSDEQDTYIYLMAVLTDEMNKNITQFTVSVKGWHMLNIFKNEIELSLDNNNSILGELTCNVTELAIKIASNNYIYDLLYNTRDPQTLEKNKVIPSIYIKDAIKSIDDNIWKIQQSITSSQSKSITKEQQAIIKYLDNRKNKPSKMTEITQSRRQVLPFKSLQRDKITKNVKNTVVKMVEIGLLKLENDKYSKV